MMKKMTDFLNEDEVSDEIIRLDMTYCPFLSDSNQLRLCHPQCTLRDGYLTCLDRLQCTIAGLLMANNDFVNKATESLQILIKQNKARA